MPFPKTACSCPEGQPRGRPARRAWGCLVAGLLAAWLGGCDAAGGAATAPQLPALRLTADPTPTPLLAGTVLRVTGAGFVPSGVGTQRVVFLGVPGGDLALDAQYVAADALDVRLEAEHVQRFPVDGPPWSGTLRVERSATGQVESAERAVVLQARSRLEPQLTSVAASGYYPGATLTFAGDGFLQWSEGTTAVRLAGTFTPASGGAPSDVSGLEVPTRYLSRSSADLVLTPDLLGLAAGHFTGRFQVINYVAAEPPAASLPRDAEFDYLAPGIDGVEPTIVRRGQRVRVGGHGFVATDPALESATLLLLDGTFRGRDGSVLDLTGPRALALFPDAVPDAAGLTFVLRVARNLRGELEGLGLAPGTFSGRVLPFVVWGTEAVVGSGPQLDLVVAPQLQVVYVRFLPGFDDGLEAFGLRAVGDAVRAQVIEAAQRPYAGISLSIRAERPADFAEYAVVEIGGRDPNGQGLLGLDNTAGKDVNNLRFDDVVGGYNAETRQQGYWAYGGVFVESFLQFSPRLAAAAGADWPVASGRFDEIFGPFAPSLGGTPVDAAERGLDGPRAAAIAEAVRVLGNLVGDTAAHEVGHTLGLAAIEGALHNFGDEPNCLMDAGAARSFEERAVLAGQGPAVFCPHNRAYLERVLPAE